MKKNIKKIVSLILVCVMTFSLANVPAKAATYTDVNVTSLALDGGYNYPRYHKQWNTWFVYFDTAEALPDIGDLSVKLRDGKREFTAIANKADSHLLLLRIDASYLLVDGDTTITVPEQEHTISGEEGITLKGFSFTLSGGMWYMSGQKNIPTIDYKVTPKFGVSWGDHVWNEPNEDTRKKNLYLYLDDTSTYNVSGEQWTQQLEAIATDSKQTNYYGTGVWKYTASTNSCSYINTSVTHFTGRTYHVPIDGAAEGDIYKFQGVFRDPMDGKTYLFAPITVRYTSGAWVDISGDYVEKFNGYLRLNKSDWAVSANETNSSIYLLGGDDYLPGFGNTTSDHWSITTAYLTADGGTVLAGDNPLSVAEFQKFNGVNNWYFIKFNEAVAKGTIVTIEGTFKNNKSQITFEKSQFLWNGSQWEEVLPQGKLTMSGSIGSTGQALYPVGTDSYLTDRTYEEWNDAASRLRAASTNTESGIYLDGVKKDATLIKFKGNSNYYYIEGIAGSTEGQLVTVKGVFYDNWGNGKAVVEIEESTFRYDGEKWVDYVPNSDVAIISLAVDQDYLAPKKNSDWPIWEFYLKTNQNITTNLEYFINYKIGGSDTVYTTVVQDLLDIDNVFYSKIEQDKIDEAKGTTITYLAGEYTATTDSSQKMIIAENFTFYVNQYGWSTVQEKITPDFANKVTFTHAPNIDNGGNVNGFYLLADCDDGMSLSEDWSKHLTPVALSPEDTYYTSVGEGGLWKNGTKTDVKITKFTYVDKSCYYVHAAATEGATYEVKGLFKDSNGRKVAYQPIKVTYKDGAWKQVYTSLNDTGVQHDVNSDLEVNSVDLIRLIRHTDNNMISVNDAQKDINYSGAFDKYDEDSLRKVLVGMIYYKDGVVHGTPIYNKNKVIEKMAFASPKIGTWNNDKTVFTALSDEEIDAKFQAFKAIGLTLLCSEEVATHLGGADAADPEGPNKPLWTYLEAAKRNGLGVIVASDVLYSFVHKGPESNAGNNWKAWIDDIVSTLKKYSAFRGFMIGDEWAIDYAENYTKVVSYIREAYPDLLIINSMKPAVVYEDGKGASLLTKDTGTNDTEEKAYGDYISSFASGWGHFIYDMYPLTSTKSAFWSDEECSVDPYWYTNLKYVADQVKANNYAFTTGITIQACQLSASRFGILGQKYYYLPTETEDIGFQVYTALAYGMKDIHYFSYEKHWADECVSGILDGDGKQTRVYNAVNNVNAEIDKFSNVYQSFAWKDTLDLSAGAEGSLDSKISTNYKFCLTSAKAENARAFVGCMKDTDGFDGYMVSNAAGPRENVTSKVTLTFDGATKAIVYTNGVPKTEPLTNGVCTVNVPSGEGVFVIPLR